MSITCATASCGSRASKRLSKRASSLHANRFCHTKDTVLSLLHQVLRGGATAGPRGALQNCANALSGKFNAVFQYYLHSSGAYRATAFCMMMTSNSTQGSAVVSLPAACLPANVFKMNLNNWQMPSAAVVACQPFFFAACWPPVCGKRQLYPERFLPKT